MKNILVIGAGTMGSGIAQAIATYNNNVQLYDSDLNNLGRSIKEINKSLDRFIKKGIIDQERKDFIINNIQLVKSLDNINFDIELCIEAIFENTEAKISLINSLNSFLNEKTILSSNTSSISITKLAGHYIIPEKFIGLHFMNPVPIMPLVEIIKGLNTAQETYDEVANFVKSIDKTPVLSLDYPGFISNRILMPMINEAIFCLYENIGTKEDIDTVMKLGMNHPIGPLALADLIGLDVCLSIMIVLYNEFKDSKYRPCPLLVKMVEAGLLGRKTGQGFYKY